MHGNMDICCNEMWCKQQNLQISSIANEYVNNHKHYDHNTFCDKIGGYFTVI